MAELQDSSRLSPPRVSVVIPTYKRLDLLPRAIQSVFGQTMTDWELIISDDEDPPGPTWQYLQTLSDPRIRITRNTAKHGQCGNVNHVLKQSKGEWIKFLYDDDLLRPECLEVMLKCIAAVGTQGDNVVLASCGIDEYRDGKLTKSGQRDGPEAVLVPRAYAPLFSLRGEPVAGGVPTQLMIHRRVVEAGVLFEQPPELISGVDSFFVLRARALGDNLIVNRVLAELHQGKHETVTSKMNDQSLDREFDFLVREQYARRDPTVAIASLAYFRQSMRLIRAAHRARNRRFGEALRMLMTCWHPQAWLSTVRLARSRLTPSLKLTPHHRVILP